MSKTASSKGMLSTVQYALGAHLWQPSAICGGVGEGAELGASIRLALPNPGVCCVCQPLAVLP